MLRILRAEFRRAFYHRSNLIFVGITILFSVLALSFYFPAIFDENATRAMTSFQENLAFPNLIYTAFNLSDVWFFLMIPAVAGHLIGLDYRSDTWKMILPRLPQRGLLLTCKIINLAIYCAFLFLVILLLISICALIGALWLKTSVFSLDAWHFSLEKQEKIVSILVFTIWYAATAVFFTTILRSATIGTFATFAFYFSCLFIRQYSPEAFSMWFAPTHFGNLFPPPESAVPVYDSTRPNFSSLTSWLIIIAHISGSLALSYIALKRQEFSGG